MHFLQVRWIYSTNISEMFEYFLCTFTQNIYGYQYIASIFVFLCLDWVGKCVFLYVRVHVGCVEMRYLCRWAAFHHGSNAATSAPGE